MYRIEKSVLSEEYIDYWNYDVEEFGVLKDNKYYTQGFNKDGEVGTYCDDYLYIFGNSNSERIICAACMGENISKLDFTIEVFFEGIDKDKLERKVYVRTQSFEGVMVHELNSDDEFEKAFDMIKSSYHSLPEDFDDEYNRLMTLFIPQLQACREYLMVIGNKKLNKATDFKK